MEKGFTLIELLAVIVILAIIALIATPIVLNIINDSKEASVIRSVEFYTDAVQNKIMQENMKQGGTLNPKECIVGSDGNVTCDGVYYEVDIDGEKPTSGSIIFEKEKIVNVSLTIEGRKIIMDATNTLVSQKNAKICIAVTEDTKTSGNVPEGKFNIGDEYRCKVNGGTFYTFFILSTDGNKVNLILDRNINSDGTLMTTKITKSDEDIAYNIVPWISLDDYIEAGGDATIFGEGKTDKGPITVVKFLEKATESWVNIPDLNMSYDDEGGVYGTIQLAGKARIPTYSEVISSEIGCKVTTNVSCPMWLVNYTDIGDYYLDNSSREIVSGISGYWLLKAHNGSHAWYVYAQGGITYTTPNKSEKRGVRPVISVLKNNLSN